MLLVEKYRPTKVAEFIGITDAKQDALDLIKDPYASAWLYIGASGTGKTSLALAIAEELGAELHHIPSQKCTIDAVTRVREKVAYAPMFGSGFHLILVDEADQMSSAAQNAWLSILDSTNRPENTIIIFTANDTDKLEPRFLSRVEKVKFSTYGIAKETQELLARVWSEELPGQSGEPNFARIVKEANNNIRESLQQLQRFIRRARNSGESSANSQQISLLTQ